MVIPVERLEARACDVREGDVRRRLRQLSQHEREFRTAEQHGRLLARGGLPSKWGTACYVNRDDQILQCSWQSIHAFPGLWCGQALLRLGLVERPSRPNSTLAGLVSSSSAVADAQPIVGHGKASRSGLEARRSGVPR